MFGRPPPSFLSYIAGTPQLHVVDTTLVGETSILQVLKNKIQKARVMMKDYAD